MTNGKIGPAEIPPRRVATFKHFVDKLKELQREHVSIERQLAVIDWWIGKLFLLRADVEVGKRI